MAQSNLEFEEYLKELSGKFEITQISPDSLSFHKTVILDTREKVEFEISRLQNAIWVGYDDFSLTKVDTLDRHQEIIVYCSVGYRSSKIGVRLKEAGFTNVKNLYGGIFKWANEENPIYNDSTQTIRIHTYNKSWGRFVINPGLEKVE